MIQDSMSDFPVSSSGDIGARIQSSNKAAAVIGMNGCRIINVRQRTCYIKCKSCELVSSLMHLFTLYQ
jgi:hypothetical protein